MKTVAIIQARMGSSRLPGKVMLPLGGKPVIEQIVNRLGYCSNIDHIVVATSSEIIDDKIEQWCRESCTSCFRGSLSDVLDRYYKAAKKFKASNIVRITADCPVIDPQIVDEVIKNFLDGKYDAYSLSGEFPDGLDCQVFKFTALERAWVEAKLPSEREHVGPYIEKNINKQFKIGGLEKFKNLSHLRWTLDEKDDYKLLKEIYNFLYQKDSIFTTSDILDLLEKNKNMIDINSHIVRNEGYLKSIQNDG